MADKKRPLLKIVSVARGPVRLKATKVHKSKKTYNRKKEKTKLKFLTKTAPCFTGRF